MNKHIALIIFLLPLSTFAQGWANDTRFHTGTWTIANVKYEFSPKLNFFAEAQTRSQVFFNDFNYWEAKTFVHYSFTDQFYAGGGVGTYHQYGDYENFDTPQKQKEFRVWLEMFQKSNGGRIVFEHRYRLEDRFIQKLNATTQEFTNNYDGTTDEDRYRFRYRLQALIPITHKKMEANTFYANVSNEIMFTHKLPYFNQNRFFTGFGYKFAHSQVQIGVMHQFLKLTTTERRKDYMQITFSKTIKRQHETAK